jgi:hypothetical protein
VKEPPVSLADAKKKREREAYNRLVLQKFDEMEHADKRKVLDHKAEVQIKARERL